VLDFDKEMDARRRDQKFSMSLSLMISTQTLDEMSMKLNQLTYYYSEKNERMIESRKKSR